LVRFYRWVDCRKSILICFIFRCYLRPYLLWLNFYILDSIFEHRILHEGELLDFSGDLCLSWFDLRIEWRAYWFLTRDRTSFLGDGGLLSRFEEATDETFSRSFGSLDLRCLCISIKESFSGDDCLTSWRAYSSFVASILAQNGSGEGRQQIFFHFRTWGYFRCLFH